MFQFSMEAESSLYTISNKKKFPLFSLVFIISLRSYFSTLFWTLLNNSYKKSFATKLWFTVNSRTLDPPFILKILRVVDGGFSFEY